MITLGAVLQDVLDAVAADDSVPAGLRRVAAEVRDVRDGGVEAYVGQAYVQRFVPAGRLQDVLVLLVHGGGLTGVCWETTPVGRPGWLIGFLRAGLPVDVLDNTERGRAGGAFA